MSSEDGQIQSQGKQWPLFPYPQVRVTRSLALAIIISHKKRHYLLTLTDFLLYVVYSVRMFIAFLSPFHLLGTDKACEID